MKRRISRGTGEAVDRWMFACNHLIGYTDVEAGRHHLLGPEVATAFQEVGFDPLRRNAAATPWLNGL